MKFLWTIPQKQTNVVIIIHSSKPIECTALRVSSDVSDGLGGTMACQCGCLSDTDGPRPWGSSSMGAVGRVCESSGLPARFCCELKTALKKLK